MSDSETQIQNTLSELKNRQNDDGSFDLYSGTNGAQITPNDSNRAYLTAYVVNFLTIANEHGVTIPKNMQSRALDFLRNFAGTNITNESSAYAAAFAIYVATRNGFITTSYIDSFEEYANKNIRDWQSTIMGTYIASSYKLLKQNQKADNLISRYKPTKTTKFEYHDEFNNNIVNSAIYDYLQRTHFNAPANYNNKLIIKYIDSGNYTSFTSGMIIMAMADANGDTSIQDIKIFADNSELPLNQSSGGIFAKIPNNINKLNVKCGNCNSDTPLFYTIFQSGMPKNITEYSAGLEVTREYYDINGNRITYGNVGDTITVKIFIRTRGRTEYAPNVVITDLLPGGFIANKISGEFDFAETREDRILIYTNASRQTQTITYTAELGTAGEFQVPPIHAMAMNNPTIRASNGRGNKFTVLNAPVE